MGLQEKVLEGSDSGHPNQMQVSCYDRDLIISSGKAVITGNLMSRFCATVEKENLLKFHSEDI